MLNRTTGVSHALWRDHRRRSALDGQNGGESPSIPVRRNTRPAPAGGTKTGLLASAMDGHRPCPPESDTHSQPASDFLFSAHWADPYVTIKCERSN